MDVISIFQKVDSWVWGPPLIILLIGTGVYFTIRLCMLQVFKLPLALKLLFFPSKKHEHHKGDISSFAALCTALSATIGTGNIVGVATSLKMGGPGALLWMWIAAFFGMSTKYAECLLGVKYRVVDANGQIAGGPMYYIERGMGNKFLANLFAVFAVGVALLGIGTFAQANAITQAAEISLHIPKYISAVILVTLVAMVTLGGIQSISSVAKKVVPFMALFYIIASVTLLALNLNLVPAAVALIFKSAFTGHAAIGGFMGATVRVALQSGISRGIFSNESGLGSAPIAAAAAKTDSCVRQGLISMTGTFFDTILICTMTGLALVVTGMWSSDYEGAAMTSHAFGIGLHANLIGQYIVNIGLIFFAFTTIIGWNYYGERALQYLFGVKAIKPYKILFIALIFIGAFLKLDLIWIIADIVNGLMAFPNLIALLALSGVVAKETREYFKNRSEL